MSRPAERFRWTVDRYYRALETGFLAPDERFELINGELIAVVPPSPPHARTVRRLNRLFSVSLAPDAFIVCVQDPIDLGPDCHPEPDVALVRGPESRYQNRHPGAADVVLAIEIADTSMRFDRDVKLPLDAEHGIPEVWLIDVNQQTIESHREPLGGSYQQTILLTEGVVSPAHCPDIGVDIAKLFSA